MDIWGLKNGKPWFDTQGKVICNAYLHAELQDTNGDDRFCIGKDDYEILKNKRKGTETVTVHLSNGNEKQATFYYWTHIQKDVTVFDGESVTFCKEYPYFRGLVVLDNDTESIKYAKRKQKRNAEFL